MGLKNLLVVVASVLGMAASALAAVTVGTGETLRSTDAALDSWRTVNADGSVVYTADIELAGGTFVFDDVVPGDFTGRVTGTGSLVFNNQNDFWFRDGTGLQEGSTVDVSFPSVHTLYLAPGNIFGAASRVTVKETLVRTINAAGGLIFPEGQEVHLNGCACYGQGQTWEFHGPLVLDGAMSFAEGGQFNIGGPTAGNGCFVNACDVVLDFAGASLAKRGGRSTRSRTGTWLKRARRWRLHDRSRANARWVVCLLTDIGWRRGHSDAWRGNAACDGACGLRQTCAAGRRSGCAWCRVCARG